jgi:RNA polymerase sigma-70 factor (ECF subfamily)
VSAWKNQAQFTGGNVHAWLTTILRNKIIDSRRPSRARSFLHHSIQMDDDGSVKEGFKALTYFPPDPHRVNVTEVVKQVIETLPENSRDLLRLRLLEGMAQKDIAKTLNMPIGTVMSRGFRVMKDLREKLMLLLEA